MNKGYIQKVSLILATTIGLIIFIKLNDNLSTFFERVKDEDAVYTFMTANRTELEKQELRLLIEQEAKQFNVKPIDAYIDRVYHAIPGYNGLEVDIDATYKYNVNLPRGEKIHYIYKEIKPKVHLDDLGLHPIYKGNPNKKMVAFMVNVAWGTEELKGMLDILEQENIKLTFFMDGMWLKQNMELAATMLESGHELANHAYSHPDMSKLSRAKQMEQISKTNELLEQLNVKSKWFAPPSGDYNQTTVEVAKEFDMHTVLWTIDTIDWQNPPPAQIVNRISQKIGPGHLVLMHPKQVTKEALLDLINVAREKGLAIGTVSETLSSDRERKEVVSPILF